MAAALGMRVRVMRRDPSKAVEHAEAVVAPADLHALLAWADFVVLAVPLTDETRGLIGAAELRAMRSSAYLINVARGEVVDEAELVRCLRAGGIAGAALDVFNEEPLPPGHPLWALPNARAHPAHLRLHRHVLRPHAGAVRGQPGALPRRPGAAQRRRQAAGIRKRINHRGAQRSTEANSVFLCAPPW